MGRQFEVVQAALSAGELTPRVHGRLDIEQTQTGAAEILNLVVRQHGDATKRPASRYAAETKDSSAQADLISFQYSNDQSYALEFGNEYIRFFTNRAQITVPTVTAAITNGEFTGGITDWDDRSSGTGAIAHDATNGRLTLNSGGSGATNQASAEQDVTINEASTNHYLRFRVISPLTSLDAILQIGSTSTGSEIYSPVRFKPGWHIVKFDPGANATAYIQFLNDQDAEFDLQIDNVSIISNGVLELQSPYQTSDVPYLHYTQSADVLFLGSDIFRPYELQRFANDEWSLVAHDLRDGPFGEVNITDTTFTASATTGNAVTITASATEGINGGQGFLTTDVGRFLGHNSTGASWGWGIITARASSTQVTVAVLNDFASVAARNSWMLGVWNDTNGWPHIPTFHAGRAVWGKTRAQPNTVWLSRSDDFNNYRPFDDDDTVVASHSFSGNTATDQVNAIRWLASSATGLMIGTSRAEFIFRAASSASVFSPSNKDMVLQTNRGSQENVRPEKIGHLVMFLQRGAKVLRQASFDFDVDGVTAPNISILSGHLLKLGITKMAYQQNDDSLLWMVRSDGRLICLTHEQDQQMRAFHQHQLGGSFGSGSAVVESVANLANDGVDEVWLIVKRTINGTTKRYVEYLSQPFDEDLNDTIEEAVYVDSSIRHVLAGGTPTVITGLGHLEGETVKVLLNGATHPDKTVSSGSITLDRGEVGQVAQIGLGYTARIKTLPLDFGIEGETTRGKIRRVFRTFLQLLSTVGGFVGSTGQGASADDDLQELQFREPSDAMDQPIPPFTGFKRAPIPGRHTDNKQVIIQHTDPLPITILSLLTEQDIGES